MIINTEQCKYVLMTKSVSAYSLEKSGIGLTRTTISAIRSGKTSFEKLPLRQIMKVQQWIDDGNYRFTYDYTELNKF